MDYFHRIKGSKKKIWLVHGETSRSEALCEALKQEHDGEVSVAELGQTVEF
jgi:metallo-beta-lactamase family protein